MLLKFTSLELQPILPQNTKFRADIFKNDEVIDILVWVGLARKLPGLQYLRASCSMHAISRYCETRPKIIDFILFIGSEKSPWLSLWLGQVLGRAYIVCSKWPPSADTHARRRLRHWFIEPSMIFWSNWVHSSTRRSFRWSTSRILVL
jgi:hypothetical protein